MLSFIAALLLIVAPAPLRLDDVLSEVDRNAPAIDVARADLAVRRAAVDVAGAWEDPSVSVMAEAIPLAAMTEESEPTMLSYRISQSLNLFGRRGLAKRIASSDVRRYEAGARRVRWNARAEAVGLFYELWMIDEMLRIVDEQLALLARMREGALALVRAGMGGMGHHDVLRADSEIAAMEAERASFADERLAVAAMLNTLRGRDPTEPIGSIELPGLRELPDPERVHAASANTPEVAAARAMKDGATAQRELARRMYLPMVMVDVEYEQNLDGMPDGLGAGLSVTVPLWWWDRQRNEVAMARAMERAAERETVAMTVMADAELRMAWSRARAAERKVAALENAAIPKLRETLVSIETAYIAGTEEFITLLDAVMELKALEAARADAVVRRGVARYELERIAGNQVLP